MSVFGIRGSSSNVWNYSDKSKDNYMESITGLVVEIDNPQARDFNTGKPAFWDDGNPKRNFRFCIKGRSGQEVSWIFSPVKKGAAMQALGNALDPTGQNMDIALDDYLGKVITVSTVPGAYNARNPRPWNVKLEQGIQIDGPVRGVHDLSVQQQPQQRQGSGFEAEPEGVYSDEEIPF